MLAKNLSKSAFASLLEISLPVLTHIGSGRNKPGLEMIQKILSKFPDISPDWLVLGAGSMYREKIKKVDIREELEELEGVLAQFPDFESNARQVSEYHKLLLKEILYLRELGPFLDAIGNSSVGLKAKLSQLKNQLELKQSV